MPNDVRDALSLLIAALERHFDLAQLEDLASDEALDQAEQLLQDAFFSYDDLLFTTFGAELPFDMVDDDDAPDGGDNLEDDADYVLFEGEDEEHDRQP